MLEVNFLFAQIILILFCNQLQLNMAGTTTNTFMYFGYGSNLLARRIHIQNPNAVRKTTGLLKNYRLDFYNISTRWNGAPATIVEDENHDVYGAVWEINLEHLHDLDRQEGVQIGMYQSLTVPINLPTNETISCRTYKLVNNPTVPRRNNINEYERNPSKTYLDVILEGAIESNLPDPYLNFLQSIVHNGQLADQTIINALEFKKNNTRLIPPLKNKK